MGNPHTQKIIMRRGGGLKRMQNIHLFTPVREHTRMCPVHPCSSVVKYIFTHTYVPCTHFEPGNDWDADDDDDDDDDSG